MSNAKLPKALQYRSAVRQFLNNIADIACTGTPQFEKSTKNRIYFFVPEVHRWSCSHPSYLYVFVRKKDLSVEIYDVFSGEIITAEMMKHFDDYFREYLNA